MEELLNSVLSADIFASRRKDEMIDRRLLMDMAGSSQLMMLSFIRDAVEMSIPESYAVQGLSPWGQPRT